MKLRFVWSFVLLAFSSSCIEKAASFSTLPSNQHRRVVNVLQHYDSSSSSHRQFCPPEARTSWPASTTLSQSSSDDDDDDTGSVAAIRRPDPSILLSAKGDSEQQLGVASIGAGLLLGTYLMSSVLAWLDTLSAGFVGTLLDFTVPLPLGLIFTFVGATHFFYKDEYAAIVPPSGSWGGLWNVPTPGADQLGISSEEEYHVLWSGVAEMGGGLLLILGGLHVIPVQVPAVLLFLLTLAISPANIYMFTHDVPLAFAPPLQYPDDHIVRGVVQVILLSLFWFLASH
jgi:uncharacterized membrane protein